MTESDAQAIEAIRGLVAAGRVAEAARLGEDCLRVSSAPASACIFRALLLTATGRANDAVAQYEEALALAPDVLSAYMGIAEIFANNGWLSSATVVMENARTSAHFTPAAQEQFEALETFLVEKARVIRETPA